MAASANRTARSSLPCPRTSCPITCGASTSPAELVDDSATDHGEQHPRVLYLRGGNCNQMPVDQHDVREHAGPQRSVAVLFPLGPGVVDRIGAQRRLEIEPLLGVPPALRLAVERLAGDRGVQD